MMDRFDLVTAPQLRDQQALPYAKTNRIRFANTGLKGSGSESGGLCSISNLHKKNFTL